MQSGTHSSSFSGTTPRSRVLRNQPHVVPEGSGRFSLFQILDPWGVEPHGSTRCRKALKWVGNVLKKALAQTIGGM